MLQSLKPCLLYLAAWIPKFHSYLTSWAWLQEENPIFFVLYPHGCEVVSMAYNCWHFVIAISVYLLTRCQFNDVVSIVDMSCRIVKSKNEMETF